MASTKVGAGIVSRGVLLDLARAAGSARLQPGTAISPADLERAERAEGVRVESGDVLLVRTGHLQVFKVDGDRVGYMRMMPGLGLACAEWLHDREVAAVATDTNAVGGDSVRGCEDAAARCTWSACAISVDARRNVRPRRPG
jgi:kynurenine formamidase